MFAVAATCGFLLLHASSSAQATATFTNAGKIPALIGTAFSGVKTNNNSILVRDWENFYVYSFAAGTWEKLKFKSGRLRSMKRASWISTVYLPSFRKVITLSDEFEVLDTEELQPGYIKIDGSAPVLASAAVWQDKIYIFGGFISTPLQSPPPPPRKTFAPKPLLASTRYELSQRMVVFDPATLAFQELDTLPGYHYRLGAFINDQLYALGPTPGTTPSTDIIRYDPTFNVWDSVTNLTADVGAIAHSGDMLYMLGLRGTNGFLVAYNTRTAQLKEFATNVPWTQGIACIHEGKLYYFAGMKKNPTVRDVFFRDPRWLDRRLFVLDLAKLPP